MANTTNLDLVKPAGTDHALISVLNQNSEKIDAFAGKTNTSLAGVQDGIAILANGDTHAAIASGQFVYVKNHGSLAEGLYRATAAIATDAALSTSNLAADASGGMNALKSDIDTLNSNMAIVAVNSNTVQQPRIFCRDFTPSESIASKSYGTYTIPYGGTFTETPVVVASVVGSYTPYTELTGVNIISRGVAQCSVRVYNNYTSALTPTINLIAIGA